VRLENGTEVNNNDHGVGGEGEEEGR